MKSLNDIFQGKRKTYKMNLTSDEILMELDDYDSGKEQLFAFANCLRMSSAVKFAKYIPPQNESEKCFEQTKEMITAINNNLNKKPKVIFDYFNNITFGQPLFFILFAIIPFLIFWKIVKGKKQTAAMGFLLPRGLSKTRSWKNTFQNVPFILRLLALSCIIIALARPQIKFEEQQSEGEGVDIILCIDVSGSMTAQDFTPNRMEAAKKVAEDFVNNRPDDRIGIVIFSGESFTQCPLTTDHYVLISQIEQIRNGLLEDGTAIGSGLATSVDRLKKQ